MTLQSIFNHVLRKIKAVAKNDLPLTHDIFTTPPSPQQGNIAFPCFILAKVLKRPPHEIAAEIAAHLKKDTIIAHAQAVGPYVNIFVDPKLWNKAVLKSISAKKRTPHPTKIMLEYSSPNTHKEFHVGHVRNISLGAALVNIVRATGHEVIPVNYINDTGTHIAKCLWALMKFHKGEEPLRNKGEFLGKVYVEATKKSDDDEGAKKEISVILQKFEAKDAAIYELWQKTRQWSLDQFSKIYKEMNVSFDHVFYDSELLEEGKKIAAAMLAKGIAKKENGAVLVDLSSYHLDVFLLIKSDGTALYQTKDLALAQKKYDSFDIDESWHVVDVRQTHYFRQLFKTLQLNGFDKKLVHVPYEFVTLPEGAMSSRKGNVVLYGNLMQDALLKARQETKKRHSDWKTSKVHKVARTIAHAAIKFSMLKHENIQVITFELDKALSFEGDTGPYLLYTYARACSLLRKAGTEFGVPVPNFQEVDFLVYNTKYEHELLALISQWLMVVQKAGKEQKPSLVATYLLQLAHVFNELYHHVPVLHHGAREDVIARVYLVKRFSVLFKRMMTLLNIRLIDEM